MRKYKYYSLNFKDFEIYEMLGEIPNIYDIQEILIDYTSHNKANTFVLQDFKIDLILKKVRIGVIFYYEEA